MTLTTRKKVAKPQKERFYAPIWTALKHEAAKPLANRKPVVLATHKALHSRIIKAVCKEKLMDLGYKLELVEAGRAAELVFASRENILEIQIMVTIGVDDL